MFLKPLKMVGKTPKMPRRTPNNGRKSLKCAEIQTQTAKKSVGKSVQLHAQVSFSVLINKFAAFPLADSSLSVAKSRKSPEDRHPKR